MSTKPRSWLTAIFVLLALSPPAHAEKQGYSYIGFGYELSDYQETLDARLEQEGQLTSIGTDYRQGNVAQSSGTHIRISDRWGAHLIQGATVTSNASREQWELDGTTVQTNGMVIQNTFLKLLGDWGVTQTSSVLFGLGYQSFEFNRFDFDVTETGVANNIEAPPGSVTENGLSVVAIGGYQWSNFFNGQRTLWYSQARVLVETPVYHEVSNTALDANDRFTNSFNGYNAVISASLGYQLTRHITLAFDVRASYQFREESSRIGANGESQVLPDNRYYTVKPALVAYWSY